MKDAFEKGLSFLQIEFFRGNSDRLVQRMLRRYQAKKYEVDIADGTVTAPMVSNRRLLAALYSRISPISGGVERPQGFWGVATSISFPSAQHGMVKPMTCKDLRWTCSPGWKGQMIWSTSLARRADDDRQLLQTMGQRRPERTCKN